MALVREGNVLQLDSGEWEVTSQTTPGTVYHVNGTCSCDDAYYRGGMCKHRLSVYLTRKAMQLMAAPVETLAAQELPVPETPAEPVQSIDPKFLTFLHGKPFVKYAGLLTMATARGLVSLDAAFISVSADLALAKATATFQDGRNFTEAADAT